MVSDGSSKLVLKPIYWMGSSRKDLRSFPKRVQSEIGYALYAAQQAELDPDAKPLKGFSSAQVVEIVNRFSGNAYRGIHLSL